MSLESTERWTDVTQAPGESSRLREPGTGLEIRSNCNPDIFSQLQPEWDELCARAHVKSPFLECRWFRSWWQAFGKDHQLQLVTIRRSGQLQGVLPLMLSQAWIFGIPCRRLGAISNEHTPRFDFILSDESKQIHQAAWEYLLARQPEWDILDLPRLPETSETLHLLSRFADERGIRHSIWKKAPGSPWVDMEASWGDYLQQRSAGFRKSLRRKFRQLSSAGRYVLETVTEPDAIDQALADGFQIEAKGWKNRSKTAIATQTEALVFYTRLARDLTETGNLRLHFLALDDKRIAFDYSIFRHNRLYSLKSGLDIDHAKHSPGTLLLYLILEKAHGEELLELDLLGTADEFKMQWTRNTRPNPWLLVYSDSIRGRLLFLLKVRAVPAIKRMIQRFPATMRRKDQT